MENCDKKWFVLRDLKRANSSTPAYKELKDMKFEVFTPMRWRISSRGGRKVRELVPFIQDLVFVHDTFEKVDEAVGKIPTLQFRFGRGLGYRVPMTVRTEDMDYFMSAVAHTEDPVYYAPGEITPDMYGRTVRIIGGFLDGFEGKLLKSRGTRTKTLLVEIPGHITMAVKVNADYVEVV